MPRRTRVILADAGDRIRAAGRGVRENGPEMANRVMRPAFLEKHAEGTTRISQVMAFLLLGPFILVSLRILAALATVFEAVLGRGAFEAGTDLTNTVSWLVTALNLGLFILVAWMWFQFVRTSGFGMFAWTERRSDA